MNKKLFLYKDYIAITFFSLLIIFSRPLVGIYILGFRVGELLVGVALFLYFYFLYKYKSFPPNYIYLFYSIFLISISFVISSFLNNEFIFSTYIFQTSSYIWTISFIFIGYLYKADNKNIAYYFSSSLIILYIVNTIYYPGLFINFFTSYSDKFELAKASSILISIVFVNILNFYLIENKKFVNYFFIFSTSLFLPLLLFNSRGSFLSLVFFILMTSFYKRNMFLVSLKRTFAFIAIFSMVFIASTYNIFGELDFSKRSESENIEISSVSSNLNKLIENKNTVDVFLSFYIYEGRIYSRDGTTDWRLDIWQDIIEDLNDKNQIYNGYGYSSILPIMVDPEAPGRLGEDGLNENVHNYFFTILARGGLIQLILFLYFHYKVFIIYKQKNKNSFVLVLIIPSMFNAFLDVAMESVQFPLMYYVLLGFMISTKRQFV